MKTPKDFDYDLWIAEDGKCMVRVKSTGEVTEVDRKVMRVLRAEEKRLRREIEAEQENSGELFLDLQPDDETGESWLIDTYDFLEELMTDIAKDEFISTLTPAERPVFNECLIKGAKKTEYACEHGVTKQTVQTLISRIKEKAKKFF